MRHRIAVIGSGFRPLGDERPPEEIAGIVSDGFETKLVEIPDGIFPSDSAAREIVDVQYAKCGMQAAADGFDALYINTVGDYGLAELRDAVNIPVIGSGETACRMAASYGDYSIVTIWPPALSFIYERVLQRSGVSEQHRGITYLSSDTDMESLAAEENFVTDMRSCSLTSMSEIRSARDAAIEQSGSAAVILGCTCMAPAAAMLNPNASGITLDPLTFGYRTAEYCLAHHVLPQDLDYQVMHSVIE